MKILNILKKINLHLYTHQYFFLHKPLVRVAKCTFSVPSVTSTCCSCQSEESHCVAHVVSLSPATPSVFMSLGKILNLNCFVDLSISGTCPLWGMLQCKCRWGMRTGGLAEKCKAHNHKTINVVSSSPATASVFMSLRKMLDLHCFIDQSVPGTCWLWGMLQSTCRWVVHLVGHKSS